MCAGAAVYGNIFFVRFILYNFYIFLQHFYFFIFLIFGYLKTCARAAVKSTGIWYISSQRTTFASVQLAALTHVCHCITTPSFVYGVNMLRLALVGRNAINTLKNVPKRTTTSLFLTCTVQSKRSLHHHVMRNSLRNKCTMSNHHHRRGYNIASPLIIGACSGMRLSVAPRHSVHCEEDISLMSDTQQAYAELTLPDWKKKQGILSKIYNKIRRMIRIIYRALELLSIATPLVLLYPFAREVGLDADDENPFQVQVNY